MAIAPSPVRSSSRFHAGVEQLCRSDLDARALLRAFSGLLRAAIPSDRLLLLRTDPTTVLPTDGLAEALPPGLCKRFWDNELLEDDYNKFVELARGEIAATLLEATGNDLTRSRRYNTMYRELGVGDELRVSFTARDGSCWGVAQIIRAEGAVFSAAERDLVSGVAPLVASALRARLTLAPPAVSPQEGPALVILNRAGEIQSVTAEARKWLAELAQDSGTGMAPVPEPVYLVAGRARLAYAGRDTGPACAQVRTVARGWLHLHATCLDGTAEAGDWVAVIMTPAQASDLMPLLALSYRLTRREQEVLQFLARGMSTVEMAQHLRISSHTVRDHIKALFGKVAVRSRAELVSRVFTEHYFDRLDADVDRT